MILLVVLALAYGLRWEKGEEVSENNTKLVYYHDRWLGQSWIKHYSTDGFYELPVISDYLVVSKAQEIRETDQTVATELNSINQQYSELGALAEKLVDKKRKCDSLRYQYKNEWHEIDQPLKAVFDFAKQEEYIQSRIPADILQASYTYDTYASARQSLLERKESIEATTKNTARAQLTDQAKQYRRTSTFIWATGFILVVLWLLSFLWKDKPYSDVVDISQTGHINKHDKIRR